MKKIAFLLMSLLLITSCYDDSALQEQFKDLESRVDSLETLCAKLNTNYTSLQTIVDALESEDHVTAMAPVMEGNQIVGYTLTFKKSGPVTIYCETAPDVKVDGDSWLASYDGGQKWQRVGATVMSSGDLYIKSIKLDGQYVYLTLSDGKTEVKVPIGHIPPVMTPVAGYCKAVFAGVANPTSVDYAVGVVVGESKDAVKELIAGGELPGCSTKEFAKEGAFEIVADCCPDVTNYYVVYTYSNGVFTWSDFATFETNKAEMTAAVKSISGASAVIEGKVTLKSAAEIRVEIESFGDAEDSGHRDYVTTPVTMGKDGSFTVTLKNLQFNMPYGYYVVVNYGSEETGDRQWSERYEFTTELNEAEITCEVSGVTTNSIVASGKILLKYPSENASARIEYRLNEGWNSWYDYDYEVMPVSWDEFGNYHVELEGLNPLTAYQLRLRVFYSDVCTYDDNAYEWTDIIECMTAGPYDVVADLNPDSAKNLSSIATANCYIVSEAGLYKFRAVKGNDAFQTLSGVASASILWETFGTSTTPDLFSLISGVCYKEGYVVFQTAEIFKEGNAVIAAKDASGNILWSWHIWLVEDAPQGQVYYNNAGTMMDRNLGATSATPGDVGALGLLYQWGRKDPFLGSSSIHSNEEAKSTITWPNFVQSSSNTGTVEYATAHPTTFICRNYNNSDWYYVDDSSTDNTRWTTLEMSKSIYDPCPAGWRIPEGGDNGIWYATDSGKYSYPYYDSYNQGMNFSGVFGSNQTIWYPASGFRDNDYGSLFDVGDGGDCWSASPNDYSAYVMFFRSYGHVGLSDSYSRAYGYSVRCLQE